MKALVLAPNILTNKRIHLLLTRFSVDCVDLLHQGYTSDGIYQIDPDGGGKFSVYCDQTSEGGGWIVVQRRFGSLDLSFRRTWNEYKVGFGNLEKEFWLGNEFLHRISKSFYSILLVELQAGDGTLHNAAYTDFKVDAESKYYKIWFTSYTGTLKNSTISKGAVFSTWDKASGSKDCPLRVGWWNFRYCYTSSRGLNAADNISWDDIILPQINFSTIKIRRPQGK